MKIAIHFLSGARSISKTRATMIVLGSTGKGDWYTSPTNDG